MALDVGDTLPELELPDQHGQMRALRDLPGPNGLVLYFYPRDNTPGCTLEAVDFQSLLPEFRRLGVEVAGVSKDSVKSHASFCGKYDLAFTLLSDGDGVLCEACGAWREKKLYGKTGMGIVRSTLLLDGRGRVRRLYPTVKAKEHAATVWRDLISVMGLS